MNPDVQTPQATPQANVQATPQAKPWSAVESSPAYQQLSPQAQFAAKQQYFNSVVSAKPQFQALNTVDQQAAQQQFLGTAPQQEDGSVMGAITRIPGVIANSAGKAIGNLANAVTHPADTIGNTGDLTNPSDKGSGILGAVTHPIDTAQAIGKYATDRYGSASKAINTLANDPVGSILDASTVLGGAGSLVGKVGEAADLPAVANAGKGMIDAATVPIQAVGKAVQPIAEGTGKLIASIPGVLGDTSGRIYDQIAKLPTKAFAYGKDPLGVLAQEKMVANNISDFSQTADARLAQRTQQLNGAINNSDAIVNIQDPVNSIIKQAQTASSSSLQDRTDLQNALTTLQSKLPANLNKMSLPQAVALKRQLADDFPFSPMEAQGTTNNLMAKVGHQIHHAINDQIDAVAPEVSDLNDRVSSLIDISKAARNRYAIESRNNPVGLIGTILGSAAAGGVIHGVEGAAGGLGTLALYKAMSSPAVLTRVASALSSMSDVDKINLFKSVPGFMDVAQKAVQSAGAVPSEVAGNLAGTDMAAVGKASAEPMVTSRPAPNVSTGQPNWPSPNIQTPTGPMEGEYQSFNPKSSPNATSALLNAHAEVVKGNLQPQDVQDTLDMAKSVNDAKLPIKTPSVKTFNNIQQLQNYVKLNGGNIERLDTDASGKFYAHLKGK